ncbi:MAG: YfhO family protein, partial [Firmicutes bacterium]|nr:YfhO family protein [Bacillota bacterium]
TSLSGGLNIALSVLYAFGSFCTKSIINTMWLANIALLPIVLLGIERIIEKKDIKVLFFGFLFCLTTNYYLAFSTGIFAALYFLYYSFVMKKSIKSLVAPLFLCVLTVGLTGGICAFIILPSWMNISASYSDMFAESGAGSLFVWSFADIAQCIGILQETSATAVSLHGFFGVIPLFASVLFMLDSKISIKEKIAAACFIAFMLLSYTLRPLYLMWHVFREPTSFYGRFAYTAAFLFILLCARCLSKFELKKKVLAVIPFAAVVLLAFYAATAKNTTAWLMGEFAVIAIFAAAYTAILYFYLKNGNKKLVWALSCVIIGEALLMCCFGVQKLKTGNTWILRTDELTEYDNTKALVNAINDSGFYRATNVNSVNTNKPLTFGYNSLETFSSQTNQRSLEKLSQLGIWCPYDYRISANYFNNTVSESIFGVKYILAPGTENIIEDDLGRKLPFTNNSTSGYRLTSDNYECLTENENGALYLNKTAFPLMFAADEAVINANEDFYDKYEIITGSFRNQEKLLNAMFGTDIKLYTEYPMQENEPVYAAVTPEDEVLRSLEISPDSPDGTGLAGYSLDVEDAGEYLIDARVVFSPLDGISSRYWFLINGIPAKNLFNVNNQMLTADIGAYKKGDKLTVDLLAARGLTYTRPILFRLDSEAFGKFYEKANENALKNISQTGADITAESDFKEEKFIFSSLSYDEGFHVYIDGAEAEKIRICDAFMGFYVPAGSHDIKISYVSPGFKSGVIISAVFLVLSIAVFVIIRKLRKTSYNLH